jgi:GLPGLI family protein
MKLLVLFIFFSIVCPFAQAQPVAVAVYQVVNTNKGITRASLLIYPNESVYVDSSTVGSENKDVREESADGSQIKVNTIVQTEMGLWLRTSGVSQDVISHEVLRNEVFVVNDNVNIEWKLLNDLVTIGILKCKTATTFFRGRRWWVAYAPEVPVKYGPWKLQGLPGLIVQAEDSTGLHKFNLVKFSSKTPVGPPFGVFQVNYPIISFHDYWVKKRAYKQKLELILQAQLAEFRSRYFDNPDYKMDARMGPDRSIELNEY